MLDNEKLLGLEIGPEGLKAMSRQHPGFYTYTKVLQPYAVIIQTMVGTNLYWSSIDTAGDYWCWLSEEPGGEL